MILALRVIGQVGGVPPFREVHARCALRRECWRASAW